MHYGHIKIATFRALIMMPSSVNCTVIGLKFTNVYVQGQTYLFIVHGGVQFMQLELFCHGVFYGQVVLISKFFVMGSNNATTECTLHIIYKSTTVNILNLKTAATGNHSVFSVSDAGGVALSGGLAQAMQHQCLNYSVTTNISLGAVSIHIYKDRTVG